MSSSNLYVGNLDPQVTESLLYELFVQVAPVKAVRIPKDRVLKKHQGFGFVDLYSEKDSAYAANVLDGTRLFEHSIRVRKAQRDAGDSANKNGQSIRDDVGPIVYVGNLDRLIDEKVLIQTFKNFGPLRTLPTIVRPDGAPSCHAFLNYNKFEDSDKAIAEMEGKMVMNRAVTIDYAFKSGSKTEKHGDQAERLLYEKAAENHYGEEKEEETPKISERSERLDKSGKRTDRTDRYRQREERDTHKGERSGGSDRYGQRYGERNDQYTRGGHSQPQFAERNNDRYQRQAYGRSRDGYGQSRGRGGRGRQDRE